MTDRRATTRQRVFKSGTIEFDGKSVECIIRNVSPTGTALDVPSPAGIPHEITVNFISTQYPSKWLHRLAKRETSWCLFRMNECPLGANR